VKKKTKKKKKKTSLFQIVAGKENESFLMDVVDKL
jgi:hypothetical protein